MILLVICYSWGIDDRLEESESLSQVEEKLSNHHLIRFHQLSYTELVGRDGLLLFITTDSIILVLTPRMFVFQLEE